MCDICRASPCVSACPNAPLPIPVCAVCGGAVEQVPLFGEVLCARCEEAAAEMPQLTVDS